MGIFAVYLHEEESESSATLRERIKDKYPKPEHYELTEHLYLVTGANLVSEVMEALGMDDNENLYAAVLRLNGSYSGRSWRAMWDWFKAAEESRF